MKELCKKELPSISIIEIIPWRLPNLKAINLWTFLNVLKIHFKMFLVPMEKNKTTTKSGDFTNFLSKIHLYQ